MPFKYRLVSMIPEQELASEALYIEQLAEQAISTIQAGDVLSTEAYNTLDRVGVDILKRGVLNENDTRVLSKIMAAVQMSTMSQTAGAHTHKDPITASSEKAKQ